MTSLFTQMADRHLESSLPSVRVVVFFLNQIRQTLLFARVYSLCTIW